MEFHSPPLDSGHGMYWISIEVGLNNTMETFATFVKKKSLDKPVSPNKPSLVERFDVPKVNQTFSSDFVMTRR
jgi:hypothetical protein